MTEVKSIRGMNDLVPSDVGIWQKIENSIRSIFGSYGYDEIRFPLVEQTELFTRTVGKSTEIVSKEMYTFNDRSGNSVSLRPEGTAGCVRACLENNLLRVDSPRLWYMGPMFRYERPQKGRSRQFHQASAEVFGIKGPYIDVELMLMLSSLWKDLNVDSLIKLEINNIGNLEIRNEYKNQLQKFFKPFLKDFDKETLRTIKENPLRTLDSKSESLKNILHEAPKIVDYLDKESKSNFENLKELLDQSGLSFEVNESLVRGLDYYNSNVFEWRTTELGAQDAVCGGGRYDSLVELLGGKPCPAVGFSIGLERLVLITKDLLAEGKFSKPELDCFFICLTEKTFPSAILAAEEIRQRVPGINLKINLEATSANSQFKKADKSGARFALIVGEDELKDNTISFKDLRSKSEQDKLTLDQTIEKLIEIF